MNPDFKPNVFTVSLFDRETNEVIATTESIATDIKRERDNEYTNFNYNRSCSMTLEDATIDTNALMSLTGMNDQMFTVICTTKVLNKLKHILKHTKKKRIKNKVTKRITREFSHPAFNEGISVKASNITLQ